MNMHINTIFGISEVNMVYNLHLFNLILINYFELNRLRNIKLIVIFVSSGMTRV
jgi:hypothetical protein